MRCSLRTWPLAPPSSDRGAQGPSRAASLLVLVILFTLLLVGVSAAGEKLTDQKTYARCLNQALIALDEASQTLRRDSNAVNVEPFIHKVKDLLASAEKVVSTGPSGLKLDNEAIRKTLDRVLKARSNADKRRELEEARRQLSSLLTATSVRGAPRDSARDREVLNDVLKRREFQPTSGETLFGWLGRWVLVAINWLGRHVNPKAAKLIGWAFMIGASVALIYVISLLIRKRVSAMTASQRRAEGEVRERQRLPSPEEALAEAERLATAGKYRDALREVYRALLIGLNRLGVVKYEESRTNWEYVRQLARSAKPETLDSFARATELFDRKWYGQEPASIADYSGCLRLYRFIFSEAVP